MPRRKSGRALNGWLLIDKPAGPTSTDIVNGARRRLNAQKAGHGGTLDPAATGLLVVAFGEATKILAHITDALKTYDFTVRWGSETTTDDSEGEATQTSDARPTAAAIEAALPPFRGLIEQVPPAFSAVRVAGERAYDLARRGEAPALAARTLYVDALDLLDQPDADRARFTLVCGKGGYVRAIARDLGRALGCFAHTETLRRTATEPFHVDDALPWTEDLDGPALEAALRPVGAALAAMPRCWCAESARGRIVNGNPVAVVSTTADIGDTCWASIADQPMALGIYRAGYFHPTRVLNL